MKFSATEKIKHTYKLKARNWTIREVIKTLEEAVKNGVPSDAEIYRSGYYNDQSSYYVEWNE